MYDNANLLLHTQIYYTSEKCLTLSSKLLHLKITAKFSGKVLDSLLVFLFDVLLKDNSFPLTYYSMKKLMKNLSLGYEKIDPCKNGCMLYFGNNASKVFVIFLFFKSIIEIQF